MVTQKCLGESLAVVPLRPGSVFAGAMAPPCAAQALQVRPTMEGTKTYR